MPENNFIYQDHFILAEQQEVSHDTSLSGNGTVNSPLGVVPGYNETVLWSGTATSGDRILSESWKNFDKISITHACTYGGARPCAPDTVVDTLGLTNKSACTFFCSDQVTTQLIAAATGAKEFYETQVTFSAIDDTTLRFYPAFVKFINYPTSTSNLQGRYNRENSREYYKIVGINRKQ